MNVGALKTVNEWFESQLAAAEQRGYERAKKDAVDLCRELADEGVTNLYEYSAAIGKMGG